MRDDAFRAFLLPRLSARAVGSYLSNLRAVERLLHIDLDAAPVDGARIEVFRERLERVMPLARARDCVSALRQYAAFQNGCDMPPSKSLPSVPKQPPRHPLVTAAATSDLMRLYADILEELRERGVTRTANGPVGDYGELLFARAFGWTLASNNAGHHDAVDAKQVRYQIKARRVGKGPGSRQLGALRRLPEAHFDVLAAVLFGRDMQVLRAALIPYATVSTRARRVEHTNSWRFILSDDLWHESGVQDATDALRAVSEQV